MVGNTRFRRYLVNELELKSDEFKLRIRTRSSRCSTRKYTAHPTCLYFVHIHFSIPNPILMLIHDVGDFRMLIVGIQAGPSLKWHLLLRFRQGHSSSIVLILYKYLIFFFFLFFFCIHSYRFFFLIEILPFSQMFDVCLSSLLSCCLWTLTTFHWHKRLRQ